MFKEANNQVKSSVKSMIYMNIHFYTLSSRMLDFSLWVFYCLIANKICYFISTINKEKNTTTFSFLNCKAYQVIYRRMYLQDNKANKTYYLIIIHFQLINALFSFSKRQGLK